MSEIFTVTVLVGILVQGVRLATPYLYASLGETFGQRSGVLNLGVEGQMLMGAFFAFYAVYLTDNLWLALLAAAIVGALMGLAMAFVTINLQAQQGISGIGFYLFGLGMSTLLFQMLVGEVATVSSFPPLEIPVLSDIPILGDVLFSQSIIVYGAYALVPLAWFVLNKTTIGMKVKAVGENPEAARYAGIDFTRTTLLIMVISGGMAGLAGVGEVAGIHHYLSYPETISSGYGFTAIIVAWLAKLNPFYVIFSSIFFAGILVGGDAIQISIGLPAATVDIFNGTLLFFLIMGDFFTKNKVRLVHGERV